jgi:hypothetical protein
MNLYDWVVAIMWGSLALVTEMRAHGARWPWERP